MPETISPSPHYGAFSRGVSSRDVELAADTLLRAGERPTIEKVREKIGRGSPNTINPLLDLWWKRLAARLDAGPAALHRIPEGVLHVAEALWMQALEESRRRAEQELSREGRAATRTQADLEVRSHVLTLREAELDSRLKDRERLNALLEAQIHELKVELRKERATTHLLTERVAALEAIRPAVQRRPPKPSSQSKSKAPQGRGRLTRPRPRSQPRRKQTRSRSRALRRR